MLAASRRHTGVRPRQVAERFTGELWVARIGRDRLQINTTVLAGAICYYIFGYLAIGGEQAAHLADTEVESCRVDSLGGSAGPGECVARGIKRTRLCVRLGEPRQI